MAHGIDKRITINIQDDDGHRHELEQKINTKGELALGIKFSPSGDTKDEVQYLREKAISWAGKVRTGFLSKQEVWLCLQSTIMKTIEYALPATIMSKTDLDNIMKPILDVGLSRAGICRKMARSVVFAPNKFQGLGLHHPYDTQGIRKIEALFNYGQPLTLQLIEASWTRTMIESGYGADFLTKDNSKIKSILTNGWILALWDFVHCYKITILRMKHNWHRQQRNPVDTYIMQDLCNGYNGSLEEKRRFNYCRLFLKVELLSDITTADGKAIRKNIWHGQKDQCHEDFAYTFVQQQKPGETAWATWRKILKIIYNCNDYSKFNSPREPVYTTTDWRWFYNSGTDRIYKKLDPGWEVYSRTLTRRQTRQCTYGNRRTINYTPTHIIPVTTYGTYDCIRIDGKGIGESHSTIEKEKQWFESTEVIVEGNIEELVEYMKKETIIILSDGSAPETGASAAWIVSTANAYGKGNYVRGKATIPDRLCDSHRAECYGILGAVMTWLKYKQQWEIRPTQPIVISCDNESAINYAGNWERHRYITCRTPDFDLLASIRILLKEENFMYQHVKGHQNNSIRPWTIYTTINIHVDELATEANESMDFTDTWTNIPNEVWQIRLQGKKLFKHIDRQIREYITEPPIKEFWHKRKRIERSEFDQVAWNSMDKVMRNSTIQTRHWTVKRAAGDCGANAIMFQRKQKDFANCPFCGQPETVEHVYKCQHNTVSEVWERCIWLLEKEMIEYQTDPNIIKQLCSGLRSWQTNNRMEDGDLIVHQSKIGWNGILEGCLGL
jgi:ribonuclease HI